MSRKQGSSIPSAAGVPAEFRRILDPIKECVEILIARRGEYLDSALTKRDAVDAGLISVSGNRITGLGSGGGTTTIVVGGGGTGGGTGDYVVDLTPPPAPENLEASGTIGGIILTVDAPTFTVGHGHAYTEFWRNTSNARGSAIKIGMAPGKIFFDPVGSSLDDYYYWARFVSVDGVAGPFNAASGVLGRASEDPSYLLGLIEGALTESALDIALRAKIDKIDVIETAVSDESQVREDDDIALAQSISNVSARLNIGGDVYSSIVAVDTKAQAAKDGNETTASQVTSLQSRIDNGSAADFAPNQKWDFTNTLDGWSTGGWTAETLPTSVRLTGISSNPQFARSGLSISGALYDKVRVRIRRVSGSGAWEGKCYYTTSGHGISDSYYKSVAAPSSLTSWNTVEFDMAALTAGGSDWSSSTITAIRIDPVHVSGDVWEIDWVAVGSRSVGVASNNFAAVETSAYTSASELTGLKATYSIKVQAGDIVGGLILGAEAAAGGSTTIGMAVRSNIFSIAPPEGQGDTKTALFVHYTTPTTINGVVTPAGTYMSAAFIPYAVINDLHFDRATGNKIKIVDADMVSMSADKILSGTIGVSRYIQSTNYVADTSGWKINGDGTAYLQNAIVRGTVYANAGWFKGALILGSATAINTGTGLYAADVSGTWKFRLGTATGSRIEWSGTAFTIYGSDGSVQLSSGSGLPWDKISSRPSDSELLNSNQQWSDISGASDLGNLIPDVDFADSSWGAFSGDWAKGAPTTINVPTAIRWITTSKTAASGTNFLGEKATPSQLRFPVNPGERLYYSARSATQSTATGTWDMTLLFYDKNLLPVTGTEWNDRLQFSVPSASEQSKSGSTIVPAGAAYAAFRTRRGSVVNAGTATGWCEMGQIRVSRTQDGATVGADWSSNVSNIPYDTVYNNDDSVALGFNPTFSDWPTGDARPTGWDAWNTGPSKETTIKRVGEFSAKFTPNGTSDYGMSRTVTWDAAPLPAGTFVSGTVDIYLGSYTGPGKPGIRVELFSAAGMASAYFTHVPVPSTATGVWQRVPFTARVPSGARIYGMRIYVFASYGYDSANYGSWTGTVYFDNLRFALFDSSVDNKTVSIGSDGSLTGAGGGKVTITGLGYNGELDATRGATFATGSPGTITGQITSSTASTYIANAAIGSAQIGSIALVGTSNFSVKSSASTSVARMEMDSRSIKVYDASGIKRVQLGDLLA